MSLSKFNNWLLLFFLFLLPWQTRYIWQAGSLNGGFWEYGTLSFYATEIILWVIIFLFAWERFGNLEFWNKIASADHYQKNKKYLWGALLFLFILLLTVAGSINKDISFNFFLHLLEALCIGLVIVNTNLGDRGWWALWFGGIVQGLFALYQFVFQQVPGIKWLGLAPHQASDLGATVIDFAHGRWLRAYGSFGSPNSLGIYLALIFIVGLVLYLKTKKTSVKIIITGGQLLILTGLILSFSRGAWLAALAGIVALGIVVWRKKVKAEQSAFFEQIIFSSLLIISFLIILWPLFGSRINLDNRLEKKSVDERISQAVEFPEIFYQHPWLGTGPGTYTLALYNKDNTLSVWDYQPVHDIYLLMLAELGIAGFITLFLAIIWVLRKIRDNYAWPIIVTLFAAGIFDHWLWSMYAGVIFFWVIIALCCYRSARLSASGGRGS